MTHDFICDWLGLPGEAWPPDHYRLLGLAPGEADAAHIEQQVHERLEKVRRYQLLHPEHATEAMNRLAQAFVCLTDPEAKKVYDTKLFQPPPAPRAEEAIDDTPVAESPDPLAWLYRRQEAARAVTQLEIPVLEDRPLWESPAVQAEANAFEAHHPETEFTERSDLVPPPVRRPPAAAPEKKDVILEAAHTSLPPRRVLGTKRAFYHRIARTRQLLRAWSEAGEYLGHPGRKLAKPIEATDLIHALITLRTELESFPPLLGQAGQPGYLVLALARQQVIVPTFQTLLLSQREALARDWRAGLKLLHAHLQFLREELLAMRRRGLLSRTLRAVNSLLHSQLGLLLLVLAFLSVVVAAWRSFRPAMADEAAQTGPEPARQVSVGPFPRPLWESNAPRRSSRQEKAARLPQQNLALAPREDSTPKATGPFAPTTVEEPTPDKKDQVEKIRHLQAEDKIKCITSVAFLSNVRFLYCNDHVNLHLCNIASGTDEEVNKFAAPLTCLTVCPLTRWIACGDETGRLYLAHEQDGVHWVIQPLEKKHTEAIHSLAISADGKRLISGGMDGRVQTWDVDAGKADRALATFDKPVRAVALSNDGSRAIAGGADHVVHFWDAKSGEEEEPGEGHSEVVTCLAMSRDGRFVFSGGKDGAIWRWQVQEPRQGTRQAALEGKITCLALSTDGHRLVSGERDNKIKLWNMDQMTAPRSFDGPNDPVFSLSFSPDGKWILSGQAAGKLVLFPVEPEPKPK